MLKVKDQDSAKGTVRDPDGQDYGDYGKAISNVSEIHRQVGMYITLTGQG